MTGLRKANAYSKRTVTPYTRKSKKKGKSFIKAVPPQNVVKFTMGSEAQFNKGEYPFQLLVVSNEPIKVQVRSNALESCRQFINKKMDKSYPGQYFFRVLPYPHHIQRENKMLTGAGSDRMQTGMQLSFGKTVGKAALLKKGSRIFMIAVGNEKAVVFTRKLIHQIRPKLPGNIRVDYENQTKVSN